MKPIDEKDLDEAAELIAQSIDQQIVDAIMAGKHPELLFKADTDIPAPPIPQ